MARSDRTNLPGSTSTMGDFHLASNFHVMIDGIDQEVTQIDAIEFEVEVHDYAHGHDKFTHLRPGRFKPGRVKMERDSRGAKDLIEWRQKVVNGEVDRKPVLIEFAGDDHTPAGQITLFHAFPAKWKGPGLDAKTTGHAKESVELVFEEMKLQLKG